MGAYGPTPNTAMKVTSALDAVDLTATTNGIAIDTQGFDGGWCVFSVNVGTITGSGAAVTVTVEESDSSGSGYTAVTGAAFTQIIQSTAATFDKTIQGAVQVLGRKRYLRLVFTEDVAITACPISGTAILCGPGDSSDADSTWEFTITG